MQMSEGYLNGCVSWIKGDGTTRAVFTVPHGVEGF